MSSLVAREIFASTVLLILSEGPLDEVLQRELAEGLTLLAELVKPLNYSTEGLTLLAELIKTPDKSVEEADSWSKYVEWMEGKYPTNKSK